MYTIIQTSIPVVPNGNSGKPVWEQIHGLEIGVFPWYRAGARQQTLVKAAYDPLNLYLFFRCEDRHIFAAVTELNGPVCTDSCVEFFASPEPARRPHYFNLEINCCGCLLAGFGPDRHERTRITPQLAGRMGIYHSVPGPTKTENPDDTEWIIEATVPFTVLKKICGVEPPVPGTVWKANFYRCGGKTDPQFAAWAPVNTPRPDFHRPEFFREIRFD